MTRVYLAGSSSLPEIFGSVSSWGSVVVAILALIATIVSVRAARQSACTARKALDEAQRVASRDELRREEDKRDSEILALQNLDIAVMRCQEDLNDFAFGEQYITTEKEFHERVLASVRVANATTVDLRYGLVYMGDAPKVGAEAVKLMQLIVAHPRRIRELQVDGFSSALKVIAEEFGAAREPFHLAVNDAVRRKKPPPHREGFGESGNRTPSRQD